MQNRPPPIISYSSPATRALQKKFGSPSGPKAVAVAGLCLGIIRLIAGVLQAVFLATVRWTYDALLGDGLLSALLSFCGLSSDTLGHTKQYMEDRIWEQAIFTGFGLWLLIASIACLYRKGWGRHCMISYAAIYLLAAALDCFITADDALSNSPLHFGFFRGAPNGQLIPLIGLPILQLLLASLFPATTLIIMRGRAARAMLCR